MSHNTSTVLLEFVGLIVATIALLMTGKHIVCVDEECKHKKKLKCHFYESEGRG